MIHLQEYAQILCVMSCSTFIILHVLAWIGHLVDWMIRRFHHRRSQRWRST